MSYVYIDRAQSLTALAIDAIADMMMDLPTEVFPVTHYKSEGLYGRQLDLPAGGTFVGKEHKQDHLLIILKGKMTLWSDQGRWDVEGPCVIESKAGTQRIGRAHTEASMLTVHATEETEIEAIEESLVVPYERRLPEVL